MPKTCVLVVLSAKVLSQGAQYFRTLVVVSFLLSGSAVLDISIYYFHWGFNGYGIDGSVCFIFCFFVFFFAGLVWVLEWIARGVRG